MRKRQYRLKTITRDENLFTSYITARAFFSWQLFAIDIVVYIKSRKCKTLKMGRMAIHVSEERVITVEMLVFGLFS